MKSSGNCRGDKSNCRAADDSTFTDISFPNEDWVTSVQPRECCTQIATVARNVVFAGQVNYLRHMDIF